MSHPVVLFDNDCALCSGSVQFIIERDPHRRFRFASIYSEQGKQYLEKCGMDPERINSIVLVEDNKCIQKSEAALEIARLLGGRWSSASLLRLVPRRIRDRAYDFIARNRYRLSRHGESCILPSPGDRRRFLG